MNRFFKWSPLTLLVLSASGYASEGHRQHDAHLHGHVEFNIAQDGHHLLIEITAPGSDVVGFEHQPENEEQHQRIELAEKTLKDTTALFTLSAAAECSAEKVSLHNPFEDGEHHEEHEHHEGHEHDKDHEHHEGHEHKADEAHHEEHESDQHAEFTVEYDFHCEEMGKLTQIETSWFEHFPNTEEIEVNLLTDTAQKSLELDRSQNVIKF